MTTKTRPEFPASTRFLLVALAVAMSCAAPLRRAAQEPDATLQKGIDVYNKGIDAFNKNDFDAALDDFCEAIEIDPKLAQAYNSRGRVYGSRGDYEKAINDFDLALQLDPRLEEAYYSRGRVFAARGDNANAIADYSAALKINPYDAQAYFYRGSAYGTQENYNLAIADFNMAIQFDPKLGQAYHLRGGAYKAKGDYVKALKDYTQTLKLEPKNGEAYNDRAWLLATCPDATVRNGAQAVADATEACALSNWKNPATIDTLAAACAEAGDFASAVKWETKCLAFPDLDPTAAADANSHLAVYQAHRPYHADP